MKYGLTSHQYQLILQCFETFSEIESVILFGSRALGNEKQGSDIDLLIRGEAVTPLTVTRLFGKLNEEVSVPFRFDLVNDHDALTSAFRKHFEEDGVVFYQRMKNE